MATPFYVRESAMEIKDDGSVMIEIALSETLGKGTLSDRIEADVKEYFTLEGDGEVRVVAGGRWIRIYTTKGQISAMGIGLFDWKDRFRQMVSLLFT